MTGLKLFPALVTVAACGRIGFDAPIAATSGNGDAMTDSLDAATVLPVHRYPLAGTLADDLGGPPLVSNGGTFVPGDPLGYAFGANQGLAVTGVVPPVYTIDVVFSFDDVSGYRKIIDFKGRGSDAGLYVHDAQLEFVVIPITGCPGNSCYTSPVLFAANVPVQVTLSRDATGVVVGFVNRKMQISFTDSGSVATFDAGGETNFYIDDGVTGSESGTGQSGRIRIYDRALTESQLTP